MRLSPVGPFRRGGGILAGCIALIIVAALGACTLPPNSRNDHPYENLPSGHGSLGW
jgi:hypothetical protein